MIGPRGSLPSSADRWRAVLGPEPGDRVLVGLSGGVDSAVAALRLLERGCEVVGVTTRNFCFDDPRFETTRSMNSCCNVAAQEAARELCDELGIVHRMLDVAESFDRLVIDDFVKEYQTGRTPSPCVLCNGQVRFPQLIALADRLQIRWVATGHYARRRRHEDGSLHVARARHVEKDQSYFLYRVDAELLERIDFPLGELSKNEVRSIARRHSLAVAEVAESQELCFVPDGDRRGLLGASAREGEIVDRKGQVLGHHPGIEFFTLGQRRGLGLGGGAPRYVVALDARHNQVVVGGEEQLCRRRLNCDEVLLRDPEAGRPGLLARTRSRHPGIEVLALNLQEETGTLELRLADDDRAPAPGQAVVLYRDDAVVGGGRLRAIRPRP